MKKLKYMFAALAASFTALFPLAACASVSEEECISGSPQSEDSSLRLSEERLGQPSIDTSASDEAESASGVGETEDGSLPPEPVAVSYISVSADGVNIRSGAGVGYSVRGSADRNSVYALCDTVGDWYRTGYLNGDGYISRKYCTVVDMPTSGDERIEAVIAEGTKLLGTPYVYGAVRLHDGGGRLNKSFTADKFDCSSLMQYIFYKGAGKLLDVNTRTQIFQGVTVSKAELRRGDLMFFTNDSRKNNSGTERVGHVALYLGGNYILHTASDYARIEEISPKRWSYFIQGQRIL